MKNVHKLKYKLLGEILEEAGLVNSDQIAVALMEQSFYTHLKIGEILVLHGWVDQEIVDFFAEKIHLLPHENVKKIGEYLLDAGFLTENDIKTILQEQPMSGIKFGSLAVLRGCISQKTLNFFLKYFTDNAIENKSLKYDISTLSKQSKFTASQQQNTKSNKSQKKKVISSSDSPHKPTNSKNIKSLINDDELIDDDLDALTWLKVCDS